MLVNLQTVYRVFPIYSLTIFVAVHYSVKNTSTRSSPWRLRLLGQQKNCRIPQSTLLAGETLEISFPQLAEFLHRERGMA